MSQIASNGGQPQKAPKYGVCNRIKYVLGYEEFLSHIKRILECRGYHVSNPS